MLGKGKRNGSSRVGGKINANWKKMNLAPTEHGGDRVSALQIFLEA